MKDHPPSDRDEWGGERAPQDSPEKRALLGRNVAVPAK